MTRDTIKISSQDLADYFDHVYEKIRVLEKKKIEVWFLVDTTGCFRASPIRLRTYYSSKKHLILLCVPKLIVNEEDIENRDESRDLISIFDTGRNHDENRKQRRRTIRKVRGSWENRRKDYRRKKMRIAS